MHHLIYLHGFLSSPQSVKAQQTLAFFKQILPSTNVHVPMLPGDISKAIAKIDALVNTLPVTELRFIGSSMGGFLATYFVENYGGKAVLVNPAVEPHSLLKNYLGAHTNPYTGERFHIHSEQLRVLKGIYQHRLNNKEHYFVMLQTGDETLDYRLAKQRYSGSKMLIEQGGDHSFVNYDRHLHEIVDFLR
ncbi:YqiA/YcfP family alpha/beta fold hydrolase [Agaribacter flavus]|uniref:YqiA/YcfP family alpha/beta fold hydrolase n=1 Tax=Agaribacter flavus TaxID=1902781 RepID=A0ABV7FM21_9ALTE